MISPVEALERLRAGNRRFASDLRGDHGHGRRARPADLTNGQAPFAIVLGCSDSRVGPELVFDQGLGDLFVVRVAGNVAGPSELGSVEFAATQLGARLVVVLGHQGCGAIEAAVARLSGGEPPASPPLRAVTDRVLTALEPLCAEGVPPEAPDFRDRAVELNVAATIDGLRSGSEALERMTADEGLVIVGAVYRLATGVVDFTEPLTG